MLGVGLVSMVLTRQFLAMIDNQRLLTALAEAGGQLEHQAMHDALTGLPNRMLFAKRLDRALFTSSSNVDVLFCDLDNFKDVNDELGHGAGDLLLKIVADRLLDCVRAGDTVARLGGDEFAILLEDCPDAREVADRIVASMDTETEVLGRRSARRSVSASPATKVHRCRPSSRPTGSTPPSAETPSLTADRRAASEATRGTTSHSSTPDPAGRHRDVRRQERRQGPRRSPRGRPDPHSCRDLGPELRHY